MSRLHDLYDRIHDRVAQHRDATPRRDAEPRDEEIAHTTLSVDQLAYGADADATDISTFDAADTAPMSVSPDGDGHVVVDDDDATDTGENWVEVLEVDTVEGGPGPGKEVDPERDLDRVHRGS